MICNFQQILLGWSNRGGRNGRDMWPTSKR